MFNMRRREFITLLSGAVAAWPVAARAQQTDRVRRIGVLMFTTSDEPESQARITALGQGLQEAGWSVGRNVRIDVRWSGGDFERVRRDAQELVSPHSCAGARAAAADQTGHTKPNFGAISSSRSRLGTRCPQSTNFASLS